MKTLSPIWSRSRAVSRTWYSQSGKSSRSNLFSLVQTKLLSTHCDNDDKEDTGCLLNPMAFGAICSNFSSVIDNTRIKTNLATGMSLGAAALVTTAGGYTLSPTMITILSNAPLAAFAFVQASGIINLSYIFGLIILAPPLCMLIYK